MIEIEVWGGATAGYLSRFPRRKFRTAEAAAAYVARIHAHLDDLGVRAAHPIAAYKHGQDVTSEIMTEEAQ